MTNIEDADDRAFGRLADAIAEHAEHHGDRLDVWLYDLLIAADLVLPVSDAPLIRTIEAIIHEAMQDCEAAFQPVIMDGTETIH